MDEEFEQIFTLGKPDLSFDLEMIDVHMQIIDVSGSHGGDPETPVCSYCMVPWPCPTAADAFRPGHE